MESIPILVFASLLCLIGVTTGDDILCNCDSDAGKALPTEVKSPSDPTKLNKEIPAIASQDNEFYCKDSTCLSSTVRATYYHLNDTANKYRPACVHFKKKKTEEVDETLYRMCATVTEQTPLCFIAYDHGDEMKNIQVCTCDTEGKCNNDALKVTAGVMVPIIIAIIQYYLQ